MEIQQLRYFVAVADTGSFSRGAELCLVAQPSLSQQIQKLERDLGYKLFDRIPRGAVLTDAGRSLLIRARRILVEVDSMQSELSWDIDSGTGPLMVGIIPTMAPYLLPGILKKFVREFPDCQLTLREDYTEKLLPALANLELDLAIMSTPIEHDRIEMEVLGQEELLLVSPRGMHVDGTLRQLALSDLRDQPAIVLHEMHCLGQQIESFCSIKRISRRIVCRSTQLATVLRLVDLGLGVSVVPEMCAQVETSRKRKFSRFGNKGPTREIAVAYAQGRSRTRLGSQFVRLLKNEIDNGTFLLPGDR